LIMMAFCLWALPVHAQSARVFTAEEVSRMNFLIERDRPRDLTREYYYDRQGKRRNDDRYKELDKRSEEIAQLEERYKQRRSVEDLRKLQGLVNRYGYFHQEWRMKQNMFRLFNAARHGGPPLNDPDNRGDAAFAQERHRRYLRILAFYVWRGDPGTVEGLRQVAAYLAECERMPSGARPSGNHHDPSCGFWIEREYNTSQVDSERYQERYVPMSLSAFAQNRAEWQGSAWPLPKLTSGEEYPLYLPEGSPARQQLWAGNPERLAALYAQPYRTTREYVLAAYRKRFEDAAPMRAMEAARRQRELDYINAEQARLRRLNERFAELWLIERLNPSQQLELENLAFELALVDYYRTRYNVVAKDRVVAYCAAYKADVCSTNWAIAAIVDANRPATPNAPSGGGPSSSPQNYNVSVRVYDQNGNYTGTTTSTPVIAGLLGRR
jgi:hypothetical protein